MAMTIHTHMEHRNPSLLRPINTYICTHTHTPYTHAREVAHRLAQSASVRRNTGLVRHSLGCAAGNSGSGLPPSCCTPTPHAAPSECTVSFSLTPSSRGGNKLVGVSLQKFPNTWSALQNTLVVTTIYPCIAGKRDNREAFGFHGRFPCSSPPHGLCKELIWNSVIVSLSLSPSLAPITIFSTANRSHEAAEQLSFKTKRYLSTIDTPSRFLANSKKTHLECL